MEDYEALVEAAADDLAPEEEEALVAEMRRLRSDEDGDGLPVQAFIERLSQDLLATTPQPDDFTLLGLEVLAG